ncbi:hypothetical protein [Paenibacillus aquistagni]|uniref:hypothetical protein n=1 Tax=Paenibacillus aquistagni TaxID=1852522 RepID=UPI00145BB6A3|nr:hypothetical protein [Paenibacillus aquistagni]NMM52051.1 hypothetical protein [Paenibacillus aquistagni]
MSSKYNFGKVENQNGALSIGDNSSANYYQASHDSLESITKQLIDLISRNEDMPDDTKKQLADTISTVAEQTMTEKPNTTIISSLYGTVDKIINMAVKSAELVSVFEKWKGLLIPFLG